MTKLTLSTKKAGPGPEWFTPGLKLKEYLDTLDKKNYVIDGDIVRRTRNHRIG